MNVKKKNTCTGNRGNFFAIDRQCWARACAAGMNVAVGYLVQACGTGHNQRTTSWSANAVERYTGISRSRAKTAIEDSQSAGLLVEAFLCDATTGERDESISVGEADGHID